MARPTLRASAPSRVTSYWEASRAPRYSVLIALPLLISYEALATFLSTGQSAELRNGADVLLRELFLTVAGRTYAPVVFGISVIGLCAWFIVRDLRSTGTPLRGWIFAAMLAEAGILALCFGTVIGSVVSHVLGIVGSKSAADLIVSGAPAAGAGLWGPAWMTHALAAAPGGIPPGGSIETAPTATKVMLALGAGVYEELVFRVLLVSLIAVLARRVFRWRPPVAAITAVVCSALIFAIFHYIGPYGDPLRLDSFMFRFIGGLAFSALYVTRGFGITAWTHALYDLLTLLA